MLRDRWLFGRKSSSFTLQWHLTQACELSCLHCYDRTPSTNLELTEAMRILDEFLAFCSTREVRGQLCLTGGNPFLYPHFLALYRAAVACSLPISILGNPVTEKRLSELVAIQKPVYYQVSLEGRYEYNDRIRGAGHFDRVLDFLGVLRRLGIPSHVMLTLHRDNLDQVVPLANQLRGVVDRFTFNRLSQVGSACDLALPTREEYVAFLKSYLVAARSNSLLGFKDNLLNIFRYHYRRPLWRGCTGFGCGAAFNFVAVLPNGDVHACRKFPSPLGNLVHQPLGEIYDSPAARRYRRGSRACRWCRLRKSCGGCLAVTHGAGLRVFEDRDPHCFMADRRRLLAGF